MKLGMERMIADIEAEVRATAHLIGTKALRPEVMAAMRSVPRPEFMPLAARPYAYANGPAGIGHGQTISQPYIVALMTDLLKPEPDQVMLEIGTGSGYQAAVLSRLIRQVYSIEILAPLAEQARLRLKRLGYNNITLRQGDGYHGWPEHGPFDGIVVTAAATHIPPALLEQLKPGARLVIPVGTPFLHQELILVERRPDGSFDSRDILGVAFVPLTRSQD